MLDLLDISTDLINFLITVSHLLPGSSHNMELGILYTIQYSLKHSHHTIRNILCKILYGEYFRENVSEYLLRNIKTFYKKSTNSMTKYCLLVKKFS